MRKQLIKVKVIPNAKKNKVVESEGLFKVYVNAPAVDGKANKALLAVLSEYFNIRKGSIKIVRGEKSREKVVEVNTLAQSVKGGA
ncbi:MAG: DUF167 domain-containing protein [Thermodesulfovibrionales bacterium]|jgi:uncharacterized protein (TIGR00251 family)